MLNISTVFTKRMIKSFRTSQMYHVESTDTKRILDLKYQTEQTTLQSCYLYNNSDSENNDHANERSKCV